MKTIEFPNVSNAASVFFRLLFCAAIFFALFDLTGCKRHDRPDGKDAPDDGDGTGVGLTMDVEKIEPMRTFAGFNNRPLYAVKFVCGTIPHGSPNPQKPPAGAPLVPGTYMTAINILNPNTHDIILKKWAVQTLPQGKPRGRISRSMIDTIKAGQGMEIDCENVHDLFGFPAGQAPFVKGFVRLEFRSMIGRFVYLPEIVAVHTAKNVLQDSITYGVPPPVEGH